MYDHGIDNVKVGQRLVDLRAGRSRETVAAAIGISVSALTMYETGRRMPRDEIKVRIAAYYHVTVESLFFAA